MSKDRLGSITLLIFISIAFLYLYFSRLGAGFSHQESYIKLFANADAAISTFDSFWKLPRIYGHPPGLIIFLKTHFLFFKKSFLSVRIFQGLVFFGFLTFLILNIRTYLKDFLVSVSLGLSFALSPLLLEQSFNFYYELPSLTLFLMSFYFYKKEKFILSTVLATSSLFTLQSFIAWPLSILIINPKDKRNYWFILPILLYGIYCLTQYYLEKEILINPTVHVIAQMGFFEAFLDSNPKRIELFLKDFVYYYFLLGGLILGSLFKSIKLKKIIKKEKELTLFAFLYFSFFILIPTPPKPRDFLPLVFIFSILVSRFLGQLKRNDSLKYYSFLYLLLSTFISIYWIQLKGLSGQWDYARTSELFKKISEEIKFRKSWKFKEDGIQRFYYDPLGGITDQAYKTTKDEDFNIFIFTPDLFNIYHMTTREIRDIRYRLNEKIYVKTFEHEAEISYKEEAPE